MDEGPPRDREHGEWLPPARVEPKLRVDPGFSIVHHDPPPPKRPAGGGWFVPVAIVVVGIVLAVAVVVSRRTDSPTLTTSPTAAPQTAALTTSPPPAVIVPSSPDTPAIPDGDSAVQQTLEDVVTSARAIRGEAGSYAGVTSFELATMLPANSYQPPMSVSSGPTDVSISATPTVFSAAAMSDTGRCFWIRDVGGNLSTFDSGEPCTGTAAVSAALPEWPAPPTPSGAPTVTP